MRRTPQPQPVETPYQVFKRKPIAVSSPPLEFSGPSGLSNLISTAPLNRVDYLSGLSGVFQLEADVSRRGLPQSGLPIWAALDERDLPEARLIDCLPHRAKIPAVQHAKPRPIAEANPGPELRALLERIRRDGISLAQVATRLRSWACCQDDVEQLAVSHTGRRYVVAVGLATEDDARHTLVKRAMAIAAVRFNGRALTTLVVGPALRRSPHLTAADCYRVWPA
jgi:hypothetical protein